MKKRQITIIVLACLLSFAAGTVLGGRYFANDLVSNIFQKSTAKKSNGSWGSIHVYTNEETSTFGTESMLTAVLEFFPGQRLQPPHQHANEEFTYIIDGGGTWFLNGKESPIKKGDLMYAKPWDIHGISNTTADTLKFFVVKWNSKGATKPGKE
jgi:mannose-6-phosphate isomerase-like protein (cupin superfamily)